MASIPDSKQAQASDWRPETASTVPLEESRSSRGEGHGLHEPPVLQTMSYNPFTDNPHAATGNYSLVIAGTINPNRPVSSMLPPLEREALMKTAGERAARRERKEVVRKFGNRPGYAQGTVSWNTALDAVKTDQERRNRELTEGHRRHVWRQLHGRSVKPRRSVSKTSPRNVEPRTPMSFSSSVGKEILKKAADMYKIEQGSYWNGNNAYRFEDLMNEVLPAPRPPSVGDVFVYNSPRPSVLDSDEEDEEERKLCNGLMALPPTELPANRMSEARLMHTFDNSSLFTSTANISAAAAAEQGRDTPPPGKAGYRGARNSSSYDGLGRKIPSQSSSRGSERSPDGSPSRVRLSTTLDLPPKTTLQLFRPEKVAIPASRLPGTAQDMRVAVPRRSKETIKDRFSVIPRNLPSTGNWEVVWKHPQATRSPNVKTLKPLAEEHFPQGPSPFSSPRRNRSAGKSAAKLGESGLLSTIQSLESANTAPTGWEDPSRQGGKRNGRQKTSEKWYEVAEELDGKPTTMDDVGPYYILGELGRLERRYTQQAAKTPGQLNLNHTLFGKNQVAALTELLIRHPEIQRLELMNNALDDAMAALVIEVVSSGVTSIDTLLLNDNLLTWMSCDRMGPLLKRRPVSPGSPLHPKPLATLQELNLSHNKIGVRGIKLICKTMAETQCPLKILDVTNCDITESGAAAIGEMLEYSSLKVLRMGWNLINVKGSMLMNEGLRRSKIVELAMPRCGLNDTGGAFIANAISGNATLEKVDLSSNNLSGGTCSVLAESMKVNKKIKHLNLRDNPLGIVGTRKLLQGMVVNESLKRVQLSGCSFLKYSRGNGDFNPNNPNGTYTLKLEDPVDRQICLELCRLRVNQGNSSWSNVKLDGKEIKEDVFSKWPKEALPISGVVQVTFQWIKRPSTRVDEALSEREFEVMWNNICGPEEDRPKDMEREADMEEKAAITDEWKLSLLNTLVIDCFFTAKQAQQIVRSFSYKETMVEAGLQAYGRIMDPQNANHLMKEVLDKNQMKMLYTRLGSLAIFNPLNPTGHYNLQLSHTAQFTVARRLLEMFQTEVDERHNEFPLRTTWNEAFINGELVPPDQIQAPHTIKLENTGSMSVSYVEQRPIKAGAKPLPNSSYSVLVNVLATTEEAEDPQLVISMVDNPQTEILVRVIRQFDRCPRSVYLTPERVRDFGLRAKNEQLAVQILRAFAVDHYITAAQLIGLLAMVETSSLRIEIVTAFWARITDRAKNFSDVMRYVSVPENKILGKRLGYYSMLDTNRPSMHYKLRMYNKSEFKVARTLFQMAINKVLQTTSTHTYMKDLHVDDDPKHVLEGPNMWQVLTGNAPDGTDPKTTLEFDFDYPDVKALAHASNLIKQQWRASQQAKEFAMLRDSVFARRGGFEADPHIPPCAKGGTT